MATHLIKTCRKIAKVRRVSTISKDVYFHPGFTDQNEKDTILNNFILLPNFITEIEENSLMKELDPYLKKLKYEKDHWDDAIQGYRETEKKKWQADNQVIIDRIRNRAFANSKTLSYIHVLDLEATGCIKPHVDSIKFCGDSIAGLSLLTDSIMRLQQETNLLNIVDFLLPRRSLYIMTGDARYKYTHAILDNDQSFISNRKVFKTRRVSVICRNEP